MSTSRRKLIRLAVVVGFASAGPVTGAAAGLFFHKKPDCECHNQVTVKKVFVHKVPVEPHRHGYCGPPPPLAPVFESAAIRRIPGPDRRYRLRYEQEAGTAEAPRPESGEEKSCQGSLGGDARWQNIDQRLNSLDQRVERIFEFVNKQQQILDKLEERLRDESDQ